MLKLSAQTSHSNAIISTDLVVLPLGQWFLNFFGSRRTVKHKQFLAHLVYKIKNILIQMGFFSFLKYTFIIFAVHLATSCGPPFENHCSRGIKSYTNRVAFLINALVHREAHYTLGGRH
jgi:hypothetical protein